MAQLVKQTWTDDDVIEVLDHLADMAKHSSDIQWTNTFLAYAMGKPGSMDPGVGTLQIEGDLQININDLSLDQIRAAQQAIQTIDATFSPVDRPLPASALAAPDRS